jgi:hypothetical protein
MSDWIVQLRCLVFVKLSDKSGKGLKRVSNRIALGSFPA